ncbi:MAG TPA: hypothetical protein P5119_12440 [Candidatus Aminicenantes bacterium]|nr:hypothetical protein [Candidatus Aminicenantes bacterium]HRY66133.1 hypothetical protein [Candidatus Aminicenantes bacterium]HRZ73047.1 hypothetical protein [Candidatus Aminicenantes bacterium]
MAKKKLIFVAIALIAAFYGYKAFQFDQRVKTFNTRIQIGDTMARVLTLMGRPSRHNHGHFVSDELADRYGLKTRETILLVYRGFYFLRDDLNFVFNPDTRELIDKDRGFIMGRLEK